MDPIVKPIISIQQNKKLIDTCILIQKKWRYKQLLTARIYITPIAKTYNNKLGKPCSRRDWDEQEYRESNNDIVMWDGPPLNIEQPTKHDIMIIWKYKMHVIAYKIIGVYSSKCRLESWGMNIGQRDRQVVYLQRLMIIDWDTWISLGGNKRCMGTSIIKKSRDNIISYLSTMLMH